MGILSNIYKYCQQSPSCLLLGQGVFRILLHRTDTSHPHTVGTNFPHNSLGKEGNHNTVNFQILANFWRLRMLLFKNHQHHHRFCHGQAELCRNSDAKAESEPDAGSSINQLLIIALHREPPWAVGGRTTSRIALPNHFTARSCLYSCAVTKFCAISEYILLLSPTIYQPPTHLGGRSNKLEIFPDLYNFLPPTLLMIRRAKIKGFCNEINTSTVVCCLVLASWLLSCKSFTCDPILLHQYSRRPKKLCFVMFLLRNHHDQPTSHPSVRQSFFVALIHFHLYPSDG